MAALSAFRRPFTSTSLYNLAVFTGNASSLNSKCLATAASNSDYDQFSRFVVCGGGAGGLAVASTLAARYGKEDVAVIEPSEVRCCSGKSQYFTRRTASLILFIIPLRQFEHHACSSTFHVFTISLAEPLLPAHVDTSWWWS